MQFRRSRRESRERTSSFCGLGHSVGRRSGTVRTTMTCALGGAGKHDAATRCLEGCELGLGRTLIGDDGVDRRQRRHGGWSAYSQFAAVHDDNEPVALLNHQAMDLGNAIVELA